MRVLPASIALVLMLVISACGSQQSKSTAEQRNQEPVKTEDNNSQRINKVPMTADQREFAEKSVREMNCYIDGLRAATMADQVIQFGLQKTIETFRSKLKPEAFERIRKHAENYNGQGTSRYAAEVYSECMLKASNKKYDLSRTTTCYVQISKILQIYQYKQEGKTKQELINLVKMKMPREEHKQLLAMIDFAYMEKIHDGVPVAIRPVTIFSKCVNN